MKGDGATERWGNTPRAVSSSQIQVRNSIGGQVGVISAWIEEYVQDSEMIANVLDEGISEAHTLVEIEALTPDQIRAFRYTLLGRALLDVAESCFIHAAGLSDD